MRPAPLPDPVPAPLTARPHRSTRAAATDRAVQEDPVVRVDPDLAGRAVMAPGAQGLVARVVPATMDPADRVVPVD